MEGIWEGFFSASYVHAPCNNILSNPCQYIEFEAYASTLLGPPSVVQRSAVGRHKQTWRLREYHLLSNIPTDPARSDFLRIDDGVCPLPGGDPLKSYFPNDTQLRETTDCLMIQYSGSPDTFQYQSSTVSQSLLRRGEVRVRDVILIGEVRSVSEFGKFNLFTLVIGPFCMGPIQIVGSRETIRWFHQLFERLCMPFFIFCERHI